MKLGAGVLAALILLGSGTLALIPSGAAQAAPVPPPGGPSEVRAVTDLPGCTSVTYGSAYPDAVGLGWSGLWNVPAVSGTGAVYQLAMAIPCREMGGSVVSVRLLIRHVAGPLSVTNTAFFYRATIDCVRPDGSEFPVVFDTYWPGAPTGGNSYGGVTAEKSITLVTTNVAPPTIREECRGIRSARVLMQLMDYTTSPQSPGLVLGATWLASSWRTGTSGWNPAGDPSDIDGTGGIELPIVCAIDNTGDDLFEIVGNVVGSMANWPGCMLIPRGWDRAGHIDAAWKRSPGAALVGALDATLPSGLSCGVVSNFSFYGASVVLNTCSITFVPAVVKTVIAAILVLGLAVLIWLRILWSVGSG